MDTFRNPVLKGSLLNHLEFLDLVHSRHPSHLRVFALGHAISAELAQHAPVTAP